MAVPALPAQRVAAAPHLQLPSLQASRHALQPRSQHLMVRHAGPPTRPRTLTPLPGINWGNGFITNDTLIKEQAKDWFSRISDANPFFKAHCARAPGAAGRQGRRMRALQLLVPSHA